MIISCAKRGRPSGGPKDVDAPVIIKSTPENLSTNFIGKEITIYFDEYVKVKNLQKQLIISPPMDPEPTVTPMGTASKYINITINDTLDDNTTYAFNFGQSIVDNNEENPYEYYRYVFSTGAFIDSLSVKGQILDAEDKSPETFVSVMLYEKDSTYTDSIVFKEKPKYITNTLDSISTFSIDNIKPGDYKLIALKEDNGNFTFQQDRDKIGFTEGFITVPTKENYILKLFKEVTNFDVNRPRQVAGQKIAFGFEGDYKTMEIEMLGKLPDGFKSRITKDPSTDTLYYWYTPKIELDSTQFIVRNKTFTDTLKHRFRTIEKDTLTIKTLSSGTLRFDEDFKVSGTIPFVKLDKKKIKIMDKDSLDVPFETSYDALENSYRFQFQKQQSQKYIVKLLPGALEDFFGNINDTLDYKARTKTFADYSDLRINLSNAIYPLIIQLLDQKGEVKYEQYTEDQSIFDFKFIAPVPYYLRVVFDANGNGKWDSGNFLKGIQPERISYYPELIEDTRANWSPVIDFTLLD